MSQLIQLKNRIKAIAAIKKITQTMRLVAMSSHSKLKKQSESIQRFKNEITPLLCALTAEKHKTIHEHNPIYNRLYILFSAEKGLCGTFTSNMERMFDSEITDQILINSHIISVGKKTSMYLEKRNITPLHTIEKVLPSSLEEVAQDLYEKIIKIHKQYKEVICVSSTSKTFFIQEPTTSLIIPITQDPCATRQENFLDGYQWLQTRSDVTKSMFRMLLKTNLLLILTNSMLSEQSARFLSMDNATRSAETLLKEMKLMFNKIRQAKITRELIELISSF